MFHCHVHRKVSKEFKGHFVSRKVVVIGSKYPASGGGKLLNRNFGCPIVWEQLPTIRTLKLTYPQPKGTFESMIFLSPRWGYVIVPCRVSWKQQKSTQLRSVHRRVFTMNGSTRALAKMTTSTRHSLKKTKELTGWDDRWKSMSLSEYIYLGNHEKHSKFGRDNRRVNMCSFH